MDRFWQNKKIVIYIALKHHTRFLTPIAEELKKKGAKVLFIVGQAERSQEITAIEQGLDYQHVFDFLSNEDTKEVLDNYQAIRDGFKPAFIKHIEFDSQVPTVMDKTFFAIAQEFVAFKNYFKHVKPDICMALHEVNRWGKLFSHHAKKNNIPFISLQEGLFSVSELRFGSIGHIQNSTLGLLWGKGSKSFICDYEAPRERAFLVGNTHLNDEINQLNKNNIRKKKRAEYGLDATFSGLLFFSAILHPSHEFIPVLEAFASNKGKKLFVKFHPATTKFVIDKWLDEIPDNLKKNIEFIHGKENTYHLIAMSDICIFSDTSTAALEALAIGRPVFFLTLKASRVMKSIVPEKKAALEFTPEKFKQLLNQNTDFSSLVKPEHVRAYLQEEVCNPEKSIDATITIMKKACLANKDQNPSPMSAGMAIEKKYSVIIPTIDQPELFLPILESFSTNSKGHDYEVLLICPESISSDTKTILDSLAGNVTIFKTRPKATLIDTMNTAVQSAQGETLIFFDENITPSASWLDELETAIGKYGSQKIFGGKIVNHNANIVHAGIVLNTSHSVVSAYEHLNAQFSHANKERPFQMVDGFMATNRDAFLSTGGFNARAGAYKFMDYCLRSRELSNEEDLIFYVPKIELIQLVSAAPKDATDESLFFYSRWHGQLWDNENDVYKTDGVSSEQLESARMTRAMATASMPQ